MPSPKSPTPGADVPMMDYLNVGMNILGDTLSATTNTGTNDAKDTAKGSAVGGGIGAALGTAILPGVGTGIGQMLGSTVGKLIGGASDRKRMTHNNEERIQRINDELTVDPNVNPYGYMEDGGVIPGTDLQHLPDSEEVLDQPPTVVNIEKGELMVAADGQVLANFENPNAYKPHNKEKPFEEHYGNFVTLPEGAIIIPKKLAKTYLEGDDITRRSVTMQLVKDQQVNGQPMVNAPMMAAGGVTGGGDPVKEDEAAGFRDPFYEASATLAHYKDRLNTRLKTKNPQAYDNYFQGMRTSMSAPDVKNPMEARRNYIQKADYNDYLTPDEVKQELGDNDYRNYLNSVKAVNAYHVAQGNEPLYGNVEGEKDLEQLNYGRRFASLQVTPTVTNTVTGTAGTNRNYTRKYSYDPAKGVSYTEEGDLTARPSYLRPSSNQPMARMEKGGSAPKIRGMVPVLNDADANMLLANDPLMNPAPTEFEPRYNGVTNIEGFTPGTEAVTGDFGTLESPDHYAAVAKSSMGGNRRQLDPGAVAKRVGAFIPGILQAGQAMQSDPNSAVFNGGFAKADSYINQMPTEFNVNDQLAEIEQTLAAGLDAVSNANTPAARAEAQNMVANAAKAKGDVMANKQRMEVQMNSERLGKLANNAVNHGANTQGVLQNFQNNQNMDAAARRGIMASAASEAYTNASLIENEDTAIDMINSISKFVDIDPLAKQKVVEDPNARNFINTYVQERVNAGIDLAEATKMGFAEWQKQQKKNVTITSQTQKRDRYNVPSGSQTKQTVIKR